MPLKAVTPGAAAATPRMSPQGVEQTCCCIMENRSFSVLVPGDQLLGLGDGVELAVQLLDEVLGILAALGVDLAQEGDVGQNPGQRVGCNAGDFLLQQGPGLRAL